MRPTNNACHTFMRVILLHMSKVALSHYVIMSFLIFHKSVTEFIKSKAVININNHYYIGYVATFHSSHLPPEYIYAIINYCDFYLSNK